MTKIWALVEGKLDTKPSGATPRDLARIHNGPTQLGKRSVYHHAFKPSNIDLIGNGLTSAVIGASSRTLLLGFVPLFRNSFI